MKFWTINDKSELLFYGPIAGEKSWLGDELTPKEFAADLQKLGGAGLTVRINSSGGDVFAAHAIYSLLSSYPGEVTVIVDGLCASAATIVAMAGDEIIMPVNAMMMIHNPMIAVNDCYTAADLSGMAAALNRIKDSIIAAYIQRCKGSREHLAALMDRETWLTAKDCLELGFCDRVDGAVEAVFDNGFYVVNAVKYDVSEFKNFPKERVVESRMTKLEAILIRLGLLDEVDDPKPADAAALDSLNDGTPVAAAVVEAGKNEGLTPESAQAIIDSTKNAAQDVVAAMVKDAAESGVNGIGAAPAAEDYAGNALINLMVNAMNDKMKRR